MMAQARLGSFAGLPQASPHALQKALHKPKQQMWRAVRSMLDYASHTTKTEQQAGNTF